jgi:hypothetical protein
MLREQNMHNVAGLPVRKPRQCLSLNSTECLLKFASLIVVLFLVGAAWADDAKKPGEPGSLSILYYVDSSAQLVPLESQVVRRIAMYHALGFAGATTAYAVKGERSPVRLKAASKREFVIRLEGSLDPLETVQFYQVNGVNGSRVARIANFDVLDRPSNPKPNPTVVDFNAAKYGVSSFKLVPIQTLAAGEYCLLIKTGSNWPKTVPGFCFGIDVSGN